jgi:polyphosphate kinase
MSPHRAAESCRLIDAEIAMPGGKPGVWAKMNSLVDPMIDKLYEAERRGACNRPRDPRHLLPPPACPAFGEHPRQVDRRRFLGMPHLVLRNATSRPTGRPGYISSADWMPRNFDRRIEYMLPIENGTVHAQLIDQGWSPTSSTTSKAGA